MRFRNMYVFLAFSVILITLQGEVKGSPTSPGDLVVVPKTRIARNVEPAESTQAVAIIGPKISSMFVKSNVSARYAHTLVTSRVINPARKANEVTFSIVIPETAFISGFSMEIDGKVYEAYVKEKEEAKKVYDEAVSQGQAAAHVAVQARDSNHFTVSVNLEPQSKAIFRLRYEELLVRRLGLYNLVLNLNPGQVLDELVVEVNIKEKSPISILLVPELRTGNEIDALPTDAQNPFSVQTIKKDKLQATVRFAPTREQQIELMRQFKERESVSTTPSYNFNPTEPLKSKEGISGQFVVQYDVDIDDNGEILVNDGYFVHFFAPKNLKPLSKHVIFVLDVSGSMIGKKISQLKEAMLSILQELNPGDYFNIIDFSYNVKVYNLDSSKNVVYGSQRFNYFDGESQETVQGPEVIPPKAKPATKVNIDKAKEIINQLNADGGTNINEALSTALKVANYGIESQASPLDGDAPSRKLRHEPMIIFLTDGDPTVGETDTRKILTNIKSLNTKNTAIFSLAFGEDADRNFLRKISLQNSGFMRHIYEAADAAQQLKSFYRQISSPLLANVKYTYPENQVDEKTVTRVHFDHLFFGSELVVAGKLKDNTELTDGINVSGVAEAGLFNCFPIIINLREKREFWPLERLWAYMNIKRLLDENDAKSEDEAKEAKKKALDIALKYSFVTPLTSLVVVKPNASSAVNAEALDNKPGFGRGSSYALPLTIGGAPGSAMYSPMPAGGGMPFAYYPTLQSTRPASAMYSPMSAPGMPISYPMVQSIRPVSAMYSPMSAGGRMPISYAPIRPSGFAGAAPAYGGSPISGSAYQSSGGLQFNRISLPESSMFGLPGPPPMIPYPVRPVPQSSFFGGAGPPPRTTTIAYPLPPPPPTYYDSADRIFGAEDDVPAVDLHVLSGGGHGFSGSSSQSSSGAFGPPSFNTFNKMPVSDDSTSTEQSPVSSLNKYGLSLFSWLEQYLSPTDDNFTIQEPSGKIVTYRLKLESDVGVTKIGGGPCTNSLKGGPGVCEYLTQSADLDKAFKDLNTYVKYSCNANGYAGICTNTATP